MSRRKQARPKACKSDEVMETVVQGTVESSVISGDNPELSRDDSDNTNTWIWTKPPHLQPQLNMSPASQQSMESEEATMTSGIEEGMELEDGDLTQMQLDPATVPFAIGVNDLHPHSCQFCEKAFAKLSYLRLHEQTHADHMPYKCEHCPRLFRHKKSRERHEKLHSADRKYKCQTCGVGYSRSDHLRNHMKSHDLTSTDQGYKCPVCLQSYMSASALTNHIKTHNKTKLIENQENAKVKMETFVCDLCQEIFTSQKLLDNHIRSDHSSEESETTFRCPICFEEFIDTELLCQHILRHNSESPATPINSDHEAKENNNIHENAAAVRASMADSKSKSNLPENSNTSGSVVVPPGQADTGVVCPYCLIDGFESLESLELHLTSVHSVKPTEVYTCNFCNAPYPNLYSLHDHMTVVHRSQHGLDITYPCSMCVQRFHSLDALAKHKGIVHSQQRSNDIDAAFCNRCNMTLASPRSLEDHMINVHNIVMDRKALRGKGKKSNKSQRDASSRTDNVQKNSTKAPKVFPSFLMNEEPPAKRQKATDKMETSSRISTPIRSSQLALSQTVPIGGNQQYNISFSDHYSFGTHLPFPSDANVNSPFLANEANADMSTVSKIKQEPKTNEDDESASNNNGHDCFKCGARFNSEEQLEAHASLHYLCVSTEYGCSSCGKNFSKPDELQKHLMDIHAHHLYRCSLCKDIFDSKVNIQVHFAIKHSNETKLYKCVSCDIMFTSETDWQVHVRLNHLNMSKPYRCLFCQESFTSEVELQCHLTTHSKQFSCPMCDEAFHIEYLLDQHINNCHSDVKPNTSECDQIDHGSSSVSPARDMIMKQEHQESTHGSTSKSMNSSIASSTSSSPRTILKSPLVSSPKHFLSNSAAQRSPFVSPVYNTTFSKSPSNTKSPIHHNLASPKPCTSHQPTPILTTPVSSIWKNTEPLHVCNICDTKFCDVGLLNIHKSEEHGVRSANRIGQYSIDQDMKKQQERLLSNNQTLLSALTSPTTSDAMSLPLATSMNSSSPHFSCMFCSQTFKSSQEYNKHMKIHVNSGNLTCSICDETFVSPSVLAEHKLTHCKIHQGNTCVVCRVALTNQEQFYAHSQDHGFEGSLLQCIVCRQTLSSLIELQMHGRHHFQTRPAFFTCCVCLKSFESKENLVSKLNSSGRTYYVCKPCYHGEAPPLHTCSQCSEKFATAQLLEKHMATHKANFQCIKCQQSFATEYEIQLHVASHMLTEGTHHECRLCGAFFDSPGKLQTHLIQHSFLGREIVCFVCNKTFESPQEIQVHALEHSSSYKKFACTNCSQKFFFSAEFDNHKLICGHGTSLQQTPPTLPVSMLGSPAVMSMSSLSSFLSPTSLVKPQDLPQTRAGASKVSTERKQNMKSKNAASSNKMLDTMTDPTVSSVTPLTSSAGLDSPNELINCSLCPETFESAISMQQHFFAVHSDSNSDQDKKKKLYKCMMCEKECSTLSALQNHILSHRTSGIGASFSCNVCKKTFTSQRYLNLHMRLHVDVEKKEESDIVTDSFEVEQNLSSPKFGPQEMIPCPVCNESFPSTLDVEAHLKTHIELFITNGNADLMDT